MNFGPLIFDIDYGLERIFSTFYPQGEPYDFLGKWISGKKYEECRKYDHQLDVTNSDDDNYGELIFINASLKHLTKKVQKFLEISSSEKDIDKDYYKDDILYILEQLYEAYYNDCLKADANENIETSDIYNVVYVKYIEPLYDLINKYPFKVWA